MLVTKILFVQKIMQLLRLNSEKQTLFRIVFLCGVLTKRKKKKKKIYALVDDNVSQHENKFYFCLVVFFLFHLLMQSLRSLIAWKPNNEWTEITFNFRARFRFMDDLIFSVKHVVVVVVVVVVIVSLFLCSMGHFVLQWGREAISNWKHHTQNIV